MNESYFEPLDEDELRDHLRLSLPPKNARGGWQFDERAVLAALDMLGIELPVRIRFMTSHGRKWIYDDTGKPVLVEKSWKGGTHYSRHDWHRITINQIIKKAGYASEVLWHELAHCMQAERFAKRTGNSIDDFHDYEYKLVDGEWGRTYQGNLLEIEARKIAAEKNTNYLLCKEVD